jgi:hypothetical protein
VFVEENKMQRQVWPVMSLLEGPQSYHKDTDGG